MAGNVLFHLYFAAAHDSPWFSNEMKRRQSTRSFTNGVGKVHHTDFIHTTYNPFALPLPDCMCERQKCSLKSSHVRFLGFRACFPGSVFPFENET